jgi:hypothetical protein
MKSPESTLATSLVTSSPLPTTTPCEFHSQQRKNNKEFVRLQEFLDNTSAIHAPFSDSRLKYLLCSYSKKSRGGDICYASFAAALRQLPCAPAVQNYCFHQAIMTALQAAATTSHRFFAFTNQ